jgi:hypothetical protein
LTVTHSQRILVLVLVKVLVRVRRHSRRPRYIAASPSALINHLLSRNLHLLALRVSQHLGLRPDSVLKHWATAKISRGDGEGDDDEVVCRAIVDKFEKEGEKGVSYADIAKKAWEAGRSRLATMVSTFSTPTDRQRYGSDKYLQLLDHEGRAAEQVPLLLQMKEDKIALVKAIDSGDTDLGEFSLSLELPSRHLLILRSVQCASAPPRDSVSRRLLPHPRRLGVAQLDPRGPAAAGLCPRGRSTAAARLLLPG